MGNSTKAGFPFYNDIGDTHLSAKGREVYNKLNWVNIMGDDDQGCLLCFDEGNSMVEAILDEEGFLRFLQL